jgi:predicted metal-dependent hydrolase
VDLNLNQRVDHDQDQMRSKVILTKDGQTIMMTNPAEIEEEEIENIVMIKETTLVVVVIREIVEETITVDIMIVVLDVSLGLKTHHMIDQCILEKILKIIKKVDSIEMI